MTSQDNVELLRRFTEYTLRTGEILPETVHPDCVLNLATYRGALTTRSYAGVEEIDRWLAEWRSGFENWSAEIEEVVDGGDLVVAVVRQHGEAKLGGPEVEMRASLVFAFRDGRIARIDMYADRDEALKASGLSE